MHSFPRRNQSKLRASDCTHLCEFFADAPISTKFNCGQKTTNENHERDLCSLFFFLLHKLTVAVGYKRKYMILSPFQILLGTVTSSSLSLAIRIDLKFGVHWLQNRESMKDQIYTTVCSEWTQTPLSLSEGCKPFWVCFHLCFRNEVSSTHILFCSWDNQPSFSSSIRRNSISLCLLKFF